MYVEATGPRDLRVPVTDYYWTRLPDSTESIWVSINPSGALEPGVEQDLDERTIIRLLRNSNKVKEVQVQNVGVELSPERIELLEVLITRAEKLEICPFQSDLAYSCLTSCLSQPNGLKELNFLAGTTQISINQAKLLFEGVASSSCLEVLSTRNVTFEPDEENNYEPIFNAFLDAFQRNRSLKTLYLDTTPFINDRGIFPLIFKAAILDTKIETLHLFSEHGREPFNVPRNLLIEALCNNECKLKELDLWNCALVGVSNDDVDQMSNDACNKSLETLTIKAENLDLTMMVEVARKFRSLVTLEMPDCNVGPHLSLLDPLLIGDEKRLLSLQRLELDGNGINEDHAIEFFRKLPQMTCIRKICLASNPFESSEAWVPVLVDAIQRNESVEHLDLYYQSVPMPEEEMAKACSKIDRALRRNQERRLTEEFLALVRSKVLPEKLWPLVLERAQRSISLNLFKTYPYTRARAKQPSESVMSNDLVNRLLKEKMIQDHLH